MSFNERTAHVWKQMIDTAHKHGIKVIGIQHPTYHFADKRKEHVDERSEAFLKEAGYDALINNGELFDEYPEYFHDPVHLSEAGPCLCAYTKKTDRVPSPWAFERAVQCDEVGKKFSKCRAGLLTSFLNSKPAFSKYWNNSSGGSAYRLCPVDRQ